MKNNNDCYRGVQRNVVFDLEGELVFGAFAIVRARSGAWCNVCGKWAVRQSLLAH